MIDVLMWKFSQYNFASFETKITTLLLSEEDTS